MPRSSANQKARHVLVLVIHFTSEEISVTLHGHEAVKDEKGLDEINPNLDGGQVPRFTVHLPNRASWKEQRTPCLLSPSMGWDGLRGVVGIELTSS